MKRSPSEHLAGLGRFCAVGGIATAVHFAALALLMRFLVLPTIQIHAVAFILSFLVSFLGHYLFTFRSMRAWHIALGRFLVVSFVALCLSTGAAALLSWFNVPSIIALLLAALCVPTVSYILNKAFVF